MEILSDNVFISIPGTHQGRLVDFLDYAVDIEERNVGEKVVQKNLQVLVAVLLRLFSVWAGAGELCSIKPTRRSSAAATAR